MKKGEKEEYGKYIEAVGRQRGVNAQEGIGEKCYWGLIGEVWGGIMKEMGKGEVYEWGGTRMRIEVRERKGGKEVGVGIMVRERKGGWGRKVVVRAGKMGGIEVVRWYKRGSAW